MQSETIKINRTSPSDSSTHESDPWLYVLSLKHDSSQNGVRCLSAGSFHTMLHLATRNTGKLTLSTSAAVTVTVFE